MHGARKKYRKWLLLLLFLSLSSASFSQKDGKIFTVQIPEGMAEKKFVIGKVNIKGQNLSDSQLQTLNYSFAKGTRLKLVEGLLVRRLRKTSRRINANKISLKIESTSNPKEISVVIVIE